MIIKRAIKINNLNYTTKARSSLSRTALDRMDVLPPKTIGMINHAINNIDNQRFLNHIDAHNTDLEKIATKSIKKLLSSDEAFNLLQHLPRHMRLQLNILRFTPYKIKRTVRDQFYEHSLRAELLLHIAKTSNKLDAFFSLREEDIFRFYEHKLNKGYQNKRKGRGRTYNDRDRNCPLHLYIKNIITRHISIDHIEEIKTWGKAEASQKTEIDPVFKKRVLNPNKSENLFIMPAWLNLKKTKFIRAQVDVNDPNQCGNIFLNLVPKEGPKEGVWIYPSKKSFGDLQRDRPECECGKRKRHKQRIHTPSR